MWSDSYWNLVDPVTETDLLDLSVDTSVPFGLFSGAEEDTCMPPETQKVAA